MNVYEMAIATWGKESQIDVAVGELAELIDALIKNRRNQCDNEKVIDEIADVHIMLEQLKIIFDKKECDLTVCYKERGLAYKLREPEKHRFK